MKKRNSKSTQKLTEPQLNLITMPETKETMDIDSAPQQNSTEMLKESFLTALPKRYIEEIRKPKEYCGSRLELEVIGHIYGVEIQVNIEASEETFLLGTIESKTRLCLSYDGVYYALLVMDNQSRHMRHNTNKDNDSLFNACFQGIKKLNDESYFLVQSTEKEIRRIRNEVGDFLTDKSNDYNDAICKPYRVIFEAQTFQAFKTALQNIVNAPFVQEAEELAFEVSPWLYYEKKREEELQTDQEKERIFKKELLCATERIKRQQDLYSKKEIVYVVGSSGAGKSTLINYLLDKRLKKTIIQSKQKEQIDVDGKEEAEIGHTPNSQTITPTLYENSIDGIVYCDCPGFFENREDPYPLIAETNIQMALKSTQQKIKSLIIVLDYRYISDTRLERIKTFVSKLVNFFNNALKTVDEKKRDSILFVFTHIPKNVDKKTIHKIFKKDVLAPRRAMLKNPIISGDDKRAIENELKVLSLLTQDNIVPVNFIDWWDIHLESQTLNSSQLLPQRKYANNTMVFFGQEKKTVCFYREGKLVKKIETSTYEPWFWENEETQSINVKTPVLLDLKELSEEFTSCQRALLQGKDGIVDSRNNYALIRQITDILTHHAFHQERSKKEIVTFIKKEKALGFKVSDFYGFEINTELHLKKYICSIAEKGKFLLKKAQKLPNAILEDESELNSKIKDLAEKKKLLQKLQNENKMSLDGRVEDDKRNKETLEKQVPILGKEIKELGIELKEKEDSLKKLDNIKLVKISENGYSLCLMSNDIGIKKNNIYVSVSGNSLQYTVIGLNGQPIKDTIPIAELSYQINEPYTLENLQPLLPAILQITSKKGHTCENDTHYAVYDERLKTEKYTIPIIKKSVRLVNIFGYTKHLFVYPKAADKEPKFDLTNSPIIRGVRYKQGVQYAKNEKNGKFYEKDAIHYARDIKILAPSNAEIERNWYNQNKIGDILFVFNKDEKRWYAYLKVDNKQDGQGEKISIPTKSPYVEVLNQALTDAKNDGYTKITKQTVHEILDCLGKAPLFKANIPRHQILYQSERGTDGDAEVVYFVRKKDLPANKIAIEALKKEIDDIKAKIKRKGKQVAHIVKEIKEKEENIKKIEEQHQSQKDQARKTSDELRRIRDEAAKLRIMIARLKNSLTKSNKSIQENMPFFNMIREVANIYNYNNLYSIKCFLQVFDGYLMIERVLVFPQHLYTGKQKINSLHIVGEFNKDIKDIRDITSNPCWTFKKVENNWQLAIQLKARELPYQYTFLINKKTKWPLNSNKTKEKLEKLLMRPPCENANREEHEDNGETYVQTILHEAVSLKELSKIKSALNDIDINAIGPNKMRPLHYAVKNQDSKENDEIISFLLENGATLDAQTAESLETPLHIACGLNHRSAVNLLLEKGASIRVEDILGNMPIHNAIMEGNLEIVELLLKNENILLDCPNKRGMKPIHLAILNNQNEVFKVLLKHIFKSKAHDCNRLNFINNCYDSYNNSILHVAALSGNDEAFETSLGLIRALFQQSCGEWINTLNYEGNTSLHIAVQNARTNIIQKLFQIQNRGETIIGIVNKQGRDELDIAKIRVKSNLLKYDDGGCNKHKETYRQLISIRKKYIIENIKSNLQEQIKSVFKIKNKYKKLTIITDALMQHDITVEKFIKQYRWPEVVSFFSGLEKRFLLLVKKPLDANKVIGVINQEFNSYQTQARHQTQIRDSMLALQKDKLYRTHADRSFIKALKDSLYAYYYIARALEDEIVLRKENSCDTFFSRLERLGDAALVGGPVAGYFLGREIGSAPLMYVAKALGIPVDAIAMGAGAAVGVAAKTILLGIKTIISNKGDAKVKEAAGKFTSAFEEKKARQLDTKAIKDISVNVLMRFRDQINFLEDNSVKLFAGCIAKRIFSHFSQGKNEYVEQRSESSIFSKLFSISLSSQGQEDKVQINIIDRAFIAIEEEKESGKDLLAIRNDLKMDYSENDGVEWSAAGIIGLTGTKIEGKSGGFLYYSSTSKKPELYGYYYSNVNEAKEVVEKLQECRVLDHIFLKIAPLLKKPLTADDYKTKSLQTNSAPLIEGLTFQEMPTDGSCLYHAIALYLDLDNPALRKIVADSIELNFEEYDKFISLRDGDTKSDYCNRIRQNEWGDQISIQVLIQVLCRPIVVIGPSGKITNLEQAKLFPGNKPIFIYFNINHYDCYLLNDKSDPKDILGKLLLQSESARSTNVSQSFSNYSGTFFPSSTVVGEKRSNNQLVIPLSEEEEPPRKKAAM